MTDLPGPGPELDRLVAERVMGWTHCSYGREDSHERPCWSEMQRLEFPAGGKRRFVDIGIGSRRGENDKIKPWSPSTRIEDAEEVLRHMVAKGWRWRALSTDCANKEHGMCSVFRFLKGIEDECPEASRGNLPHAICLAALEAVSSEDRARTRRSKERAG